MASDPRHEFSRILVARGGAIGDFVLTLPVFQALRSRFPKALIEVLGYPHIASIATLDGHVDRITRIESPAFTPLFAHSIEIPQSTRHYFSSFDLIVSYIHDPDRHFQQRVSELSAARFLTGPGRPNQTSTAHAAETLLRPLQEISVFATDHEPRLLREPASKEGARPQPPSPHQAAQPAQAGMSAPTAANWTFACHPGSGSPEKNWPLEKWVELLSWLIEETPARPVILGGEADKPQLDRLKTALPRGRYEVWENLPLPELARLLSHCGAFIGHDSGITHLAAAVGIPTTALWGSTNPDVWRPLGPHVKLVSAEEGLKHLSVEAVTFELGHLFD